MSIIIKDVSKIYGAQKAVNNVNISINKGEVVGFLGPNGAGKSTTMKMITGYLAPSAGNIEVCGMDVAQNPIDIRKKIGYLPESNPQYYEMYVREYLEFLAKLHQLGKNSKARIEEMISITGLTPEAHKKIGALSKGYKQRVGLAQAMLHNPEVLILDEPTSGLDPNQIIEIRNLIIEFGKNKTVLLSTHIMQEVSAMCQRAIIINKGVIAADNTIDELQTSVAQNKDSLKLIVKFAATVDKKHLQQLQNVSNVTAINDREFELTSTNTVNTRKAIMQLSLDKQIDLESIQTLQANLEEVFRTLTTNNN